VSANIEDYYLTPWDLGYGPHVKFDHDFIGREALEKRANGPHRKKVTLALNTDDVMRVIGSQYQRDRRGKFIEFPSAVYSMHPYDKVTKNGRTVGVSTWVGYSANEGQMLTLAILEPEHATIGSQVTFVWGEENGGTAKATVERHVQMEMRATVSPVPYSEVARTEYAGSGSWRAHTGSV
jgi:glycine cleavage system aminomethyltransferase T